MRPFVMLLVVLIAVAVTVGAAVFAYINVRQIAADSPIPLPPPPQAGDASAPTRAPLFGPTIAPTEVAVKPTQAETSSAPATQEASATEPPTYMDPGRITILLLGIDQRKGEKGPFRTDTMMLISVDPVRKTAAMISIPRDIYVKIPVYNLPDRINNANVIGDTMIKDFPGGGPALAVRTVQSMMGVPIHRYMMVNFDVFNTVIDVVAPITVCPKDPIHDDHYPDGSYGYITVDFKAGCQEMDSTHLLQYARVRHQAGDDFGRAARQQEVIRAVREKVLSLGGVSSLLSKAGEIWLAIKDSVKTDMTFEEMMQLAQLGQTIPKDNIKSAVINPEEGYVLLGKMPDGQEILMPVYEKIHELVATMFDATPGGPGSVQASAENAQILVANGAGIDGLAKLTADNLRGKGFIIVDAKNADLPGGYGRTVIRLYNTSKIKTARYLAEVLGLDGTYITTEKDGPPNVDIELVVGKDLAQPSK
jgi:polyisoprenyl-teichoic acid--peptidoglycan teichoic acid transferase